MSTPTDVTPMFSIAEIEAALARTWRWVMAAGIVAIVAGVLSILAPLLSGIAFATLLGILFLFQAGAFLADGFAVRRHTSRALVRLLLAVLYAIAGIVLIAAPLTGTITLTLVIGVLFIVEGSFRTAHALSDRMTPARGWQLGSGLLTILLGVLIVATWPSSSLWVIGTLVGINLLFWGWNMTSLALVGRRATSLSTAATREPKPAM